MKFGVSLPVRELADDLTAIRDFAQMAEGLGLNHLRIPEQIIRPSSGHLHESMMILAYIAAITERIELVPSVLILPARQTALFAKQATELDIVSEGRVRLGIGVGSNKEEYEALNVDFHTRGRRCDDQMQLLKLLWTEESVDYSSEFHQFNQVGINPLPVQRPIPMWIGARALPAKSVVRRIGQLSDGWFVLCDPNEYPALHESISAEAEYAGRKADLIGREAGVAVVGPREAEWRSRVIGWHDQGLTHLCLRTLGGGLSAREHLSTLEKVVKAIPDNAR